MAFCKVTYQDIEFIEHSINVEADSLHEAVAKAVQVFRTKRWDGCPPGSGCEITVEVQQISPTVHKILLGDDGTARSPAEMLKQRKLRQLLGIPEA